MLYMNFICRETKMHADAERILFSEEEIKNAVKALGKRITEDYRDEPPIIVGILKGSFIFMSDLVREIGLNCDIDFMIAKSYGSATVSSGTVNIVKDLDTDISGRHVLIVEDILDTARTLTAVKDLLMDRSAKSVKIAALLDKVTAERVSDLKADYRCFEVGNEFVVGYGLDFAEKYRGLKYICVLRPEIYEH